MSEVTGILGQYTHMFICVFHCPVEIQNLFKGEDIHLKCYGGAALSYIAPSLIPIYQCIVDSKNSTQKKM